MNQPVFAFMVLLVIHSLVSICAYRFLTTETRTLLPLDPTPVETTTPQQQARGESSFRIATQHEQVARTIPWVVQLYVLFGYAALALASAFAIGDYFRTMTT